MLLSETRPSAADPSAVLEIVVGFFGVTRESLAVRTRRRDVLRPRQVAMYVLRQYTELSDTEIGERFGRSHPSVANAVRLTELRIGDEPAYYREEYRDLERLLNAAGFRRGSRGFQWST